MILDKIVVGPLAVNSFVIGCENTRLAAIIDPGDEYEKINLSLKKHNLSLKYILLTHGHVDHIARLIKFQEMYSVETLMHSEDYFLFNDSSMHAMLFGLPDPGNPKINKYIKDGDIIKIGDIEVKVLHTPGHSPGSVTFLIENNLIVGDLIFQGSIGRTDLPGGNYETLIASVQNKIFTLPDDMVIYPGHGPETRVGIEKIHNPYF